MSATLFALGAIVLWATLASLGVALAHVPPFLLTGLALVIGSVPSWPLMRQWRVPPATLAIGVYGLFGFHFLLFIALRHAPAVEANLVNYLWPLFIVLLAPLLLFVIRPGLVFPLADRTLMNRRERAFLGWFGVRGVAALFYAAVVVHEEVLSREEATTVFWTAAVVVMVSLVLHGVSATPLTHRWVDDD